MANFIERTLEPGEQVVFKGRLHWSYYFRYTVWGLLVILLSVVGIMMYAYAQYDGTENVSSSSDNG